jgi:hypothetical protein
MREAAGGGRNMRIPDPPRKQASTEPALCQLNMWAIVPGRSS